jgi:hypothetical protein
MRERPIDEARGAEIVANVGMRGRGRRAHAR